MNMRIKTQRCVPVVIATALAFAATAAAKTIVGTTRTDVLRGTSAADVLDGRGGADRLYGYAGADRLIGGPGNDALYAGAGRDTVVCGAGRDIAFVDASDRVAGDCEDVRRPAPAPPPAGPNVLRQGPLAPGTYVSGTIAPRVRLSVGSGWQVWAINPSIAYQFTLTRAPGNDYSITVILRSGSVGEVVTQMAQLGTVTSGPVPAVAGNATGQRLDLVGPWTSTFRVQDSHSARVWVLGAGSRTWSVIAAAPTAEFPAYVSLVEEVLSTFVFE